MGKHKQSIHYERLQVYLLPNEASKLKIEAINNNINISKHIRNIINTFISQKGKITMSENQETEYYINTIPELIDLIATDVINNFLFMDRMVESVKKEIKIMSEESVRNILPYEQYNINWGKISTDIGIKGQTDPELVIKRIIKDIVSEVAERHDLTGRIRSNNIFYLPEKTIPSNKKLEVLMD